MRLILPLLFLLPVSGLLAQVMGKLMDENGKPLPYASVYVKGTTRGTTTNSEGVYNLRLEPGRYELIFQYVGYASESRIITVGSEPLELNVTLREQSLQLEQVVVRAGAEDPAYAVIRKAINKRKYYRDLIDAYSCRTYIKGKFELLKSPEKIFGEEIGDMEGWLDSAGTGIVYLSESESMYYKRQPDDVKEVMISSRLSGYDGGFSFNTALAMDYSFYQDAIPLGPRPLVSPIAGNALAHYNYSLEGVFYDEDGRLVNRIKVIPKRDSDPVFSGYIYIYEDFWSVHSADLLARGSNFQNPILDSMRLQLLNVHIRDDIWVPINNTIRIRFHLFGFEIGGGFTGVFSEYELDPPFEPGFFGNEIFRVEEEANDKSVEYWDSIRPVPLSEVEVRDYVRKDSLVKARDSASIATVSSFGLMTGYDRRFANGRSSLSIGSPLFNIGFNAVEGLSLGIPLQYRFRGWDNENKKEEPAQNSIYGKASYAFAEERFRAHLGFRRDGNDYSDSKWYLEGGIYLADFNDREAMTNTANTFYSSILKENLTRFYEDRAIRGGWSAEISNGLWLSVAAHYSDRKRVENHSDYSLFNKDEEYQPNNLPFFQPLKDAFKTLLKFRYKPAMKYFSYPGNKINVGSPWPWIHLEVEKAFPAFGTGSDYMRLELGLNDRISFGIYGELQWMANAGRFIQKDVLSYIDFRHFDGNETIFQLPGDFLKSFQNLPYYDRSAGEQYLEAHLSHHFNGYLLDQIPLLRKLGFRTVLSGNLLFSDDRPAWYEANIGWENVGLGSFRLLRVDIINSFVGSDYLETGFTIGMDLFGLLSGASQGEERSVEIGF